MVEAHVSVAAGTAASHKLEEIQCAARDVINDANNPFRWPMRKKRIITALALIATFSSLINGTIIVPAHAAINAEFNISDAQFPNSYWPIATWALGGASFILIILPIMEDFGVRSGFLGTYAAFIVFLVPQGVAQSFAALCVCRFFAGGTVAVIANTAAGVVGNIWEGDVARTLPTSLYITSLLTGTSIGPVIGGVIVQYLDWRWLAYLQLIWHSALFPLHFFFFEESRANVIRETGLRKADAGVRNGNETRSSRQLARSVGKSIRRPLYMLVTEPVIFFFTLWSAFTVGMAYLFTQSVEQVFRELYGWTIPQACYVQATIVLGQCAGWTSVLLSRKLYIASAARNARHPNEPVPEARLYTSVLGSFLGLTAGFLIYAWVSLESIPWIAPAIGIFVVGCGTTMVAIAITDYLLDAYSELANSAVAAVVLGENLFAAFLPLATMSMYDRLGFQWASTVLGLIALVLSFVPVCLVIWGKHIRVRSPMIVQATRIRREQADSRASS